LHPAAASRRVQAERREKPGKPYDDMSAQKKKTATRAQLRTSKARMLRPDTLSQLHLLEAIIASLGMKPKSISNVDAATVSAKEWQTLIENGSAVITVSTSLEKWKLDDGKSIRSKTGRR
jgi:hypothetical protein